ncbi:DNA repair protein XRCC2 [Fopius arisanus]|uniref:DNA repair protein XRCC2 n=1 Tax=Fopius arisanus TaxID=64838 RepID=A0A9R1TR64_9HYME|nr:PREDICTED: DNA repair protein XRCC2-like [Fopius arisanus]XP_011314266.1 PREDICTED: DNA repair protein XRCC2-like [Fopius arisanus]XP_011314267.1 PREDICTED: DNA repair protein XRCC2-like [Fopius arisanus]
MTTPNIGESGFGFLARLASKPSFLNIEPRLFPNGLLAKETVEICGETSTGKTILMSQLMTKCLLPPTVGGLGISILFLNTDHHFLVSKLSSLMLHILKNNWRKSDEEAKKIVYNSLANLTTINCYDYSQLLISLHSLDLTLLNEAISLMMIDSISSFYWLHRERNGLCTLDHYVKYLLKIIHKRTFQAKVSLIYTKTCETGSNARERPHCTAEPTPERINYRVTLESCEKEFFCKIETSRDQENLHYRISGDGVHWL